ncbi:hypothetical protein [Methylomonas sp. 11b]|uniref:hypothetical protein n=2 Tax=unclassified Methylomonas TaxID=2608980 RepID=UPI00047C76A0|nr:hypothetical protein [Methylomonas sp. 11b]
MYFKAGQYIQIMGFYQKNNYLAIFVSGLCILSLIVWRDMPYYPDEIALQFSSGRYIQDHGMGHGLYVLCPSWQQETPLLLEFPAWVLSVVMLNMSPVYFRFIPLLVTLAIVLTAIYRVAKLSNHYSATIITTAFIGVAGSGLVMARPEFLHLFNLFFCLLAFIVCSERNYRESSICLITLMGLIISAWLSIFVHIQGILFVPLTFVLCLYLLSYFPNKKITWSIVGIYFSSITLSAIFYSKQRLMCPNYPNIENFFASLTIDFDLVLSKGVLKWLIDGFIGYSQPFLYNASYTIGYLPPVSEGSVGISVLNFLIRFILFFNLVAVFVILIYSLSIFLCKIIFSLRNGKVNALSFNYFCSFLLILAIFPIVFLYFYDAAHNFYRTFFLNVITSVILGLVLANNVNQSFLKFVKFYSFFCMFVVIASLLVNYKIFTKQLIEGFEGPSIALKNLNNINADVVAMASLCDIDLDKGRIIVDDLVYDSLKRFPILFPITYLDLQGQLIGTGTLSVLDVAKPNAIIARCGYVQHANIPYTHVQNGLCCAKLI